MVATGISDSLEALEVNEARLDEALAEFQRGSQTMEQILNDRLKIRRSEFQDLVDNGTLLSLTIEGGPTLYPTWQFVGVGLRPHLREITKPLMDFLGSTLAADRVMRMPRDELDGKSIVEVLDANDNIEHQQMAWHIIHTLGSGF